MKNFFKVGFLGSGNTAKKHAEVIHSFKNYSITSVFSRNLQNAKYFAKKYNVKNFYDDISKFKNIENYDLIIVCLPPDKLLYYLKHLINLNTNIFVEKPLGLNLNEAIKILNLYKKRKFKEMKFFVGYNRRFLGSVLKLKQIISKQKSKRFVDIQDQQDLNIAKNLGHSTNTIKNWMYANSIHTIDFFSFLLRGKITKIENKKVKFKTSFIIISSIKSSSGDIGRYTGFWNIPSNWFVSLINNENNLNLKPLERLEVITKNKNKSFNKFNYDKLFKPGFYYQFNEINKALKNKKNYAVTIFDAIKSVKIVNKIYE
jgi:predicted dehydrogenase